MKTTKHQAARVPVTKQDVARVMRHVAKEHGGKVPKGSYVARLQRAEAKEALLKKKGFAGYGAA